MGKELPKDHNMEDHKDVVGQVMHRWKHHDPKPLHSGRGKGGKEGKIVRSHDQAIAVALSIAEKKAGKKVSNHSETLNIDGFSEESLKAARSLLYDEAPKGECRPKPKPRSSDQRQATQQAQQAAQQQNQTFDSMPQQQVQEAASKGGQSERKKTLPICPNSV